MKRLRDLWRSEEYLRRGSCAKLSVGRGSPAWADVLASFVPTGVRAMRKMLLTAEAPQNVG